MLSKENRKLFQVRLSGLTHPFTAANIEDVAYGRVGSVVAYSRDTTNKKVMTQSVGESATPTYPSCRKTIWSRQIDSRTVI